MTIPAPPVFVPHLRATAIGRLAQSVERFAWGLNIGRGDGSAFTKDNAGVEGTTYFADVAADFRAFHTDPFTGINSSCVLEEVKFAFIGSNGLYTRDPIVVPVTQAGGGGGSNPMPPQVAVAVSTTTDRRGPTGRGRFYIPMPVNSMEPPSLQMSDVTRIQIQGAAGRFLNAVGNQPGFDLTDARPVIVSSRGYNTPITGVRVGRTYDTIRSRRSQLVEAYGLVTAVS